MGGDKRTQHQRRLRAESQGIAGRRQRAAIRDGDETYVIFDKDNGFNYYKVESSDGLAENATYTDNQGTSHTVASVAEEYRLVRRESAQAPIDCLLFTNDTEGMYCIWSPLNDDNELDIAFVHVGPNDADSLLCNCISRHYDRIWVAGIAEDPDKCMYSVVRDAFNWEQDNADPANGAGDIQQPTWDGDEIAGDPGGEIYTRRTFSPRRYESKVLSSYAHPVPYPAGTLQSQGRSFAGKVLKADFSDAKDVYSLDLKGAYEVPGLLSLVRTLEFDRARMRAEIVDEVAFESPSSFAVPVITYCEVEKSADGRSFTLRSKGGRRVKVSVSATGGEWRLAEEIVKNPGRSDVRRLAVEMVSPVKRAAVKMSFEAQLAPDGK